MDNYEMFAGMMQSRMSMVNGANKDIGITLGTIGSAMTLIIEDYNWKIPKGQYTICAGLTMPSSVQTSTDEGHFHTVSTGQVQLNVGNRVLVVWAGKEPVIVDIVTSS